jgi:hypothetical protein
MARPADALRLHTDWERIVALTLAARECDCLTAPQRSCLAQPRGEH